MAGWLLVSASTSLLLATANTIAATYLNVIGNNTIGCTELNLFLYLNEIMCEDTYVSDSSVYYSFVDP